MERSSSKNERIYELRADGNHYNSLRAEADGHELTSRFNGTALGPSWIPVHVETEKAHDGRREHDRDGNFPFLRNVPVFDDRALEVLLPLIASDVEVLPLIHPTRQLFAINVLAVLDCIDHERSKVARARNGNVILIDNFVFKPGTFEDRHIFKIRETPLLWSFVSEEFKRRVESSGLVGLQFWCFAENGELIKVEPPSQRRRRKPR